jgi:hypothetical protein
MRTIVVVGMAWLLAAPLGGAQEPKFTYVDIQPQANGKLTDGGTNSLAALSKGEQTLAGVKFKIDTGLITVNTDPRNDPEKAEGIKVGTTCRKLYFLHACHRTSRPGDIVGYYTVTYEDNSQVTVPLVYGKDIANWWCRPNEGAPSRALVAWKGANDSAKGEAGANIRLYMTTWKNPEPKKKVLSIDFGATTCRYAVRPFCVAITADRTPAEKTGNRAKEAAALLKVAQVFINSNSPNRARERLERIIREFPETPAAPAARELLKTLPN